MRTESLGSGVVAGAVAAMVMEALDAALLGSGTHRFIAGGVLRCARRAGVHRELPPGGNHSVPRV